MKNALIILMICLAMASCRSLRKTTIEVSRSDDSTAYTSVTTVVLDTTIIPSDTATLEAILGITSEGNLVVEEVKQDLSSDISLDYAVEKTPAGHTRIRITAKTKPKEIVTQSVNSTTAKYDATVDSQVVISEKKVKGFSLWNLAWVIPVGLIVIVVWYKRKSILKFF